MNGYAITPHKVICTMSREELLQLIHLAVAAVMRQEGMTAGLARMIDRKVQHLTPMSPLSSLLNTLNDVMMISRDVKASAELYREIMETPGHPQSAKFLA